MEKYFEHDDLAYDVWRDKYQQNGESLEEFFERLTKSFYREFIHREFIHTSDLSEYGKKRLNDSYENTLRELFTDFKYVIPGGSVLAGIGTGKPVSLSNCFVLGTDDSISAIFDTAKQMANVYKRRGGVGIDLSVLRPKGAAVNNAAKTTTGVVPFMELYSQVTNTVGQAGRRGALMLSLDIRHPDSPDFAIAKRDLSKITGANISLKVSKDFMDAVEKDEDYFLRFPTDIFVVPEGEFEYNKLYTLNSDDSTYYIKKIKAKELWDTIIESNWNSAEPGILFWDNIINYDPASVYPEYRATSTNPCVTPDTTLLTKKGFKEIIDLVDKEVEIWNGYEWTTVKPFKTSDNEDVYKVEFSDGSSIKCTSYHKFILKDGIRRELRDLVIGDKLEKFTYPLIEFEKSEYSLKDWYTQGFYSGDGTIATEEGRSTRYFIDLYGPKLELMDYLNVESYGNLDEKNNKHRTKINNIINPSKLFVPIEVDIEERLSWLAGLLDSDGTLNDSGGSLAIISIEKEFLLKVKKMLITLGIRSTVGINKQAQTKNIKGVDYECQVCYRLLLSSNSVKQLRELGLNTHRVPTNANPSKEASRFIQITSIKLIGQSDVYCVTDNKNHSALFNDVMTAQCGEIPLSPYDACRLLAVNVYSLVKNPFTQKAYLDEDLTYKVFYEAQVIADTLVDVELEHIKRIIDLNDESELWKKVYEIGKKGRRTGTGITALGDLFAALNIPYGEKKVLNNLMHIKLKAELDASIDLAVIDGSFPAYSSALEYTIEGGKLLGKNDFYKFLAEEYPEQVERMQKYSRRNLSFSTVAPTGSISILAGTTSGCEPIFSLYYQRRKKCNTGEEADFYDQNGVGYKNYMVIHPKFREWYKITYEEELVDTSVENLDELYKQSPWYKQTANDLTPIQRIETQAILQKYITHSISSTVNLPEDVSKETVDTLYRLGYEKKLKGLTTYRAGSRSGILVQVNEKDNKERPPELPCKVLRFRNERKNWIAFIGIKDGKPYEIFTGINDLDEFPIPSYIESGTIIKVKTEEKSRYDFRYVDNYGYTNTLGGLNRIFNKEYWNYARFVSALLREGTAIESIINIIEKLEFSNKSLNSWQFGIIRSLKSFIEDGTAVEESCPECGANTIVYENGCKTCKTCGYSKCG